MAGANMPGSAGDCTRKGGATAAPTRITGGFHPKIRNETTDELSAAEPQLKEATNFTNGAESGRVLEGVTLREIRVQEIGAFGTNFQG